MRLFALGCAVLLPVTCFGFGQSLGNAGTITGTVTDPSNAAIVSAAVEIRNQLSGHTQKTKTSADGSFRFQNVPPNPYHLTIQAPGFTSFERDVEIRSAVPVNMPV